MGGGGGGGRGGQSRVKQCIHMNGGLLRKAGCLLAKPILLHETLHQVDGQGEDDGGVLLGGDGVQRLQVTQLNGSRRLRDDVSGLLQCS